MYAPFFYPIINLWIKEKDMLFHMRKKIKLYSQSLIYEHSSCEFSQILRDLALQMFLHMIKLQK